MWNGEKPFSAELYVPAGPVIGRVRTLRGSFGSTPGEFDAHWRKHAKLVRKHAKDLRVQRYVRCLTLLNPRAQEGIRASRNAEAGASDGVAELRWKNLQWDPAFDLRWSSLRKAFEAQKAQQRGPTGPNLVQLGNSFHLTSGASPKNL